MVPPVVFDDIDTEVRTMAVTTTAAGRNEACPCGSGRKFKKCCAPKQQAARGGRLWAIVVGVAVVGAIVAAALSFTATPAGPAPGQVWSPEHGHYH